MSYNLEVMLQAYKRCSFLMLRRILSNSGLPEPRGLSPTQDVYQLTDLQLNDQLDILHDFLRSNPL